MRSIKLFRPRATCDEPGDELCECLDASPIANGASELASVEPAGKPLKENKRAGRLRIGARFSLRNIVNAQLEIQMERGGEAAR